MFGIVSFSASTDFSWTPIDLLFDPRYIILALAFYVYPDNVPEGVGLGHSLVD